MSEIEVREVSGARDMRRFHAFPRRVYARDPLWVPPILRERLKATNPERGVFLHRGEAACLIAEKSGKIAGTICAASDPPTNEKRGTNVCVIGFFEAIHDREVARALFDAASRWGASRGHDTLYGPYNLDYENSYGVLVAGRDRPPAIMCGHSPVYYPELFEAYGFEKCRGDQLAFAVDLDIESEEIARLLRLAAIVGKKGHVTVRGVRLQKWDDEIDTIHSLLVRSLAHLPQSVPWRRDVLEETLLPFKKRADPELVLFAEYDGEPVGWFPGIDNFNEILIRVNGLRYPWNYVTLLAGLRRRTGCVSVKSILVLPEYWNTGAAIMLFAEMAR